MRLALSDLLRDSSTKGWIMDDVLEVANLDGSSVLTRSKRISSSLEAAAVQGRC